MADRKRRTVKESGFVYVIAVNGEWGLYKVGLAHDVEKRLAGLQTASAKRLVALRVWRTHNMLQSEKRMHVLLATHHVRGEWYRCPVMVIDLAWKQVQAVRGRGLTPEEADGTMFSELALDYMGAGGSWAIRGRR